MPNISIQFYATPMEILSLVKEAIVNFKLHAVAMRFRPFEAREVDPAELDSYFSDSSEFRRWAFTVDTPYLHVEHELDHNDKNPDHLRLQVGKLNTSGLEESWLSCRTDNEPSYCIWKMIAKKLKKMTLSGVTATNRLTGESGEYKSVRYTIGAKALEHQGVIMLPTVGPKGPITKLGLLLTQSKE
jgi:hypothetical protein